MSDAGERDVERRPEVYGNPNEDDFFCPVCGEPVPGAGHGDHCETIYKLITAVQDAKESLRTANICFDADSRVKYVNYAIDRLASILSDLVADANDEPKPDAWHQGKSPCTCPMHERGGEMVSNAIDPDCPIHTNKPNPRVTGVVEWLENRRAEWQDEGYDHAAFVLRQAIGAIEKRQNHD